MQNYIGLYCLSLRGRIINQIPLRCFCQESSIYVQNTTLSFRITKSGLLRNSVKTSFINSPLPHSSAVNYKYKWLSAMSEKDYSTSNENKAPETPEKPLTNKDKLKRAVKDYGATVVLFHITISLMSLGTSYLIISSGVDVASLLDKVGFGSVNDVATGASTFVVAYALHKVFAPVRISITLGATPFIVRYLRRVGILKPPKIKGV